MRQLSTIADPIYEARPDSSLDQFFLKYIKDKRDLPFIYLCLKITFTVIPLGVALFFLNGTAFWVGSVVFIGLQLYLLGPFTLMLHNTSHNLFFKREHKWGNRLIPWIFCPFMGQSPDTYFSHHIGMHHAENNLEHDKSSTMPYQRDSFIDFLKYYFRFLFIGIYELVEYMKFRNKKKFLKQAVLGETIFLGMCVVLAFFNLKATLIVFFIPLVLVRFLMMSGNWAQHAFIAPEAPENSFLNSITCINSEYNKRCFNDGYHIGHHLKPHMHWTDMPKDFQANAEKYAEQKSIVFESIDYHQIWAMLMFKRYDKLANYVVNVNGMYQSKAEIEAILRSRTRKFKS